MTLQDLEIGKSGVIEKVGGNGELRQHFLDMGVIPGAQVKKIKLAPMGDPMEIQIHGYELTLRVDDAAKIQVGELTASEAEKPLEQTAASTSGTNEKFEVHHPGLGEEGKYHAKGEGNPLPDSEVLTFALVGNQNCGKTTLFNQLTGSNQHVGNFPGVTVDRKSGQIRALKNTLVTDLPAFIPCRLILRRN